MKNIGNIKIMNSMDFDNPITIKGYLKELAHSPYGKKRSVSMVKDIWK